MPGELIMTPLETRLFASLGMRATIITKKILYQWYKFIFNIAVEKSVPHIKCMHKNSDPIKIYCINLKSHFCAYKANLRQTLNSIQIFIYRYRVLPAKSLLFNIYLFLHFFSTFFFATGFFATFFLTTFFFAIFNHLLYLKNIIS